MMISNQHKEIMINALRSAGKLQRIEFKNTLDFTVKGDQSNIVTEVDLKSEDIIIKTIMEAFPNHNILSEEIGFIDRSSEFTWIIDPLDGTSNFAVGIPWFGILVSLHHQNQCILAGSYLPIQDQLYWAMKGKGSFVDGKQLKITNEVMSNTLFSFATDFTEEKNYLEGGLEIYKYIIRNSRNVRTTNSILDFLYVAEGKYGGAINLFTKLWDISAPSLIIQEAGGYFLSLKGSKLDLSIDRSCLNKNYPVLTTTPGIFDQLRAILK